jgi:hypothetical protein
MKTQTVCKVNSTSYLIKQVTIIIKNCEKYDMDEKGHQHTVISTTEVSMALQDD